MRAIKFMWQYVGHFVSLPIIVVSFLLNGCAGLDSSSSLTQQPSAVDIARMSMTSPAEEFNRSLGALTKRDIVEPGDSIVGPQDLLDVSLYNIDATDGLPTKVQVRVNNLGFITLPLLGQVRVGGLTRAQVEESLRKGYGKYMHEPDVGVSLAENRSNSVYVLGAVRTPGVLPITGQETLRRMLAMAGGLTKDAGMFVHVSRQVSDEDRSYVINLSDLATDTTGKLNVSVRPGDFINVPLAGSFFVDGHVERASAYQLVQPYRLSQAIALAGGLAPQASAGGITVFRRGPKGEVKVLTHDLDRIRSGDEEDIQIAENDLIVVPPNRLKIILNVLLSAVGYTGRGASYSFGVGRARGIGEVMLP